MPTAPGLVVATHLQFCPTCREGVRVFEEVGRALLNGVGDFAEFVGGRALKLDVTSRGSFIALIATQTGQQ